MIEEINYFPDNLRHLRKEKGLTLMECGAEFGIKKSQMSLYEHGHSDPPIKIARKICRFFGVTMDDMFEKDIRPNPPPRLHPVADGDTEGATKESAGSAAAVGLKQPVAAESPPPLQGEDIRKMRQDLLQMMVKLEAVEMAGSNFDK